MAYGERIKMQARAQPKGHFARTRGLVAFHEQHARNINTDGTYFAARAAQGARLRQIAPLRDAAKRGRKNRADRALIDTAVGVPANFAVNGTCVQTRATADAIQNLC